MTAPTFNRPLHKAPEVAELLGISLSAFYRWRSTGIPTPRAVRIGKSLRWTPESIHEFIEAQQEAAENK